MENSSKRRKRKYDITKRVYKPEWEKEFPWVDQADTPEGQRRARCRFCDVFLALKKDSLVSHGRTSKHKEKWNPEYEEYEQPPPTKRPKLEKLKNLVEEDETHYIEDDGQAYYILDNSMVMKPKIITSVQNDGSSIQLLTAPPIHDEQIVIQHENGMIEHTMLPVSNNVPVSVQHDLGRTHHQMGARLHVPEPTTEEECEDEIDADFDIESFSDEIAGLLNKDLLKLLKDSPALVRKIKNDSKYLHSDEGLQSLTKILINQVKQVYLKENLKLLHQNLLCFEPVNTSLPSSISEVEDKIQTAVCSLQELQFKLSSQADEPTHEVEDLEINLDGNEDSMKVTVDN